jgi:hypothetical protein
MKRRALVTRGRIVAWAVSLALGLAWVALLGLVPDDGESVAMLLIAVVGLFGVALGVLIAAGFVVTVMRLLGNPTRAVSSAPGELPADFAFGISVVLFSLPSLLAHVVWVFGG